MILSAKMMMEWLGERYQDPQCVKAGAAIEKAVVQTLKDKNTVPDLGGNKTTIGMAEAIASVLVQDG
jgi:3-isopropylmalate dehydrogenase